MKASLRHLLTVFGVTASLAAAVQPAQAQRQPQTGPRLMVPTFAGPRGLGTEVAEALRERLKTDYQTRIIWVVPKSDITGILEQSGFRTDTALQNNDLRELARTARADEIVFGTATRTPSGVRLEARLVDPRDLALAQPLPPVEANNVGNAVKALSREIGSARKQLAAYVKCQNAARGGDNAGAIREASAGLGTYPTANLVRICRLNAYLALKAPTDTVLAYSQDVLRIDPRNKIALNAAAQALSDKADAIAATNKPQADAMSDSAVKLWTQLISADPSDTRMLEQVIRKIVVSANPSVALPIIDASVRDNPGNLQLLRLQWLIHLAANDFSNALTIGRSMVQMDTSLADTTYFTRMVAASASAGDTTGAATLASEGVRKFPNNAGLTAIAAQALKRSGRQREAMQMLRTALTMNPKLEHGYLQVAQMYNDAGQPDSALVALRQAVQTGNDSASFVASYALSIGNTQYKAANAMKNGEPAENAAKRAAMQRALQYLSFSDSLAPSPTPKFLMGVAHFTVGQLAATDAPKSKSCDLAALGNQAFGKAQIFLVQGGSTAPDAAKQYLDYVNQYKPVAERQQKTFCKGSSTRRSR